MQVVKIIRTNSDDLKFAQLILTMTTRLYLWMIPWVAPPILARRHHEGERHDETVSLYRGKLNSAHCRVLFEPFPFPATNHPISQRDMGRVHGHLRGDHYIRLATAQVS